MGHGQPEVRETLYPSRTAGRVAIKGAQYLPARVVTIYDETLKAFNAQAPVLAAVGLHALVEAICLDRQCGGRNLEIKISALVSSGVLAAAQAEFLHLHRFLGNEAAHEIVAAPEEEVTAGLDIIEGLLRTIYELPEIAAELKARGERRRAQKSPKTSY